MSASPSFELLNHDAHARYNSTQMTFGTAPTKNKLTAEAAALREGGAAVNATSYADDTAKISPAPMSAYDGVCQRTLTRPSLAPPPPPAVVPPLSTAAAAYEDLIIPSTTRAHPIANVPSMEPSANLSAVFNLMPRLANAGYNFDPTAHPKNSTDIASQLFMDAASIQPIDLDMTLPWIMKVVAICEYATLNGTMSADTLAMTVRSTTGGGGGEEEGLAAGEEYTPLLLESSSTPLCFSEAPHSSPRPPMPPPPLGSDLTYLLEPEANTIAPITRRPTGIKYATVTLCCATTGTTIPPASAPTLMHM
mmetsp:Transcript_21132/g.61466  ORF Transcript_21132/g.61466 Transcript_21132/m.61466 type:complete len:307 (-) Transcript_21132:222-1142(-)